MNAFQMAAIAPHIGKFDSLIKPRIPKSPTQTIFENVDRIGPAFKAADKITPVYRAIMDTPFNRIMKALTQPVPLARGV